MYWVATAVAALTTWTPAFAEDRVHFACDFRFESGREALWSFWIDLKREETSLFPGLQSKLTVNDDTVFVTARQNHCFPSTSDASTLCFPSNLTINRRTLRAFGQLYGTTAGEEPRNFDGECELKKLERKF